MIYFIQMGSLPFIKVGLAASVSSRMRQLQCASPVPLILVGTLPGGRAEECALHNYLWLSKMLNEWFDAEPVRALYQALEPHADWTPVLAEMKKARDEADSAKLLTKQQAVDLVASTITSLSAEYGVERLAEVMDCDPATVRLARRGKALLSLKNVANLLALDPLALDPFLERAGLRSAPLLGKLVRAA